MKDIARMESLGEKKALDLFRSAARRVPAYKDFLKKNGVRPASIRSITDFQRLPWVTKDNYLRAYSLEELCWEGKVPGGALASTSGSTGAPFYFPRNEILEGQSAAYHEAFLKSAGVGRREPTLVVIGFGMGVWVGGLLTYAAFSRLAAKGYNLTIIAPGTNSHEILEAIRRLGKKFDHLVLCGYPPFLKDVIETGSDIDWRALNTKIVFAAESFSEEFREHVAAKAAIRNAVKDTMNIYGTADLGTMAQETPLAIILRRRALADPALFKGIFGEATRLPTLAQFNPEFIRFEAVEEREMLLTGNSALPLVRYKIGDRGGVVPFATMQKLCRASGFDLMQAARKAGCGRGLLPWPFVFVYERSDLATKLYGAIIYPEHVRRGLLDKDLQRHLTGKFTMMTGHDAKQNEYLEIHLELRPERREAELLRKKARDRIVAMLLKYNAEYKYLSGLMPQRVEPKLTFWEYAHPLHFKAGIKQKWVK